jgi:subtilisin family serine protease
MSFEVVTNEGNVEDLLTDLDDIGTIVVAGAGNVPGSGVDFPASDDRVVAVSGTTPGGSLDPFSQYGPEIDIAAPYHARVLSKHGYTVTVEGTSYATPAIAGLAALFKSTALGGLYWCGDNCDPDMPRLNDREDFVEKAIKDAADFAGHDWNAQVGYGVPDALNVLKFHGCFRYDLHGDGLIDVVDLQMISGRYGTFAFEPSSQHLYDPSFDLEPYYGSHDLDVDIKDLQAVFGRDGFGCPQ